MQHFHAHALQHNRNCSEADRDVAGTHVLDGFLRDACRLVQAAPLWEEAWPDFLLWKLCSSKAGGAVVSMTDGAVYI